MIGRCIVIGAGSLDPAVIPEKRPGDFVIAADGGMRYLKAAGITPDYFIGDLDSEETAPETDRTILPVRKDDTDTVAACRYGLQKGYRSFLILGGLGGDRFSHSAANVQLLSWLKNQGAEGMLSDEKTEIRLLRNENVTLEEGRHRFFSLFALSETSKVTVKNALFSGEHLRLSSDFPLGVSNEIQKGTEIRVEEGDVLLVIDG